MKGKRDAQSGSDPLATVGMCLVGAAAAITSFTELKGLAGHAGWKHYMDLLLPIDIDVYGFTATRIWLNKNSDAELKTHARFHAVMALLASMAGNAINHMLDANALSFGKNIWLLIVAVSLIPPATLGALMHLVTMRSHNNANRAERTEPLPDRAATAPPDNRATTPRTVPATAPGPAGTVGPDRATTAPEPRQRTEPTAPQTAPAARPTVSPTAPEPQGTALGDRANRTKTEPDSEATAPTVKRGGRPSKEVLAKAHQIYREHHNRSVILTDRVLEAKVNEAFGVTSDSDQKVIGRRACARVIEDERQQMRTERTG